MYLRSQCIHVNRQHARFLIKHSNDMFDAFWPTFKRAAVLTPQCSIIIFNKIWFVTTLQQSSSEIRFLKVLGQAETHVKTLAPYFQETRIHHARLLIPARKICLLFGCADPSSLFQRMFPSWHGSPKNPFYIFCNCARSSVVSFVEWKPWSPGSFSVTNHRNVWKQSSRVGSKHGEHADITACTINCTQWIFHRWRHWLRFHTKLWYRLLLYHSLHRADENCPSPKIMSGYHTAAWCYNVHLVVRGRFMEDHDE